MSDQPPPPQVPPPYSIPLASMRCPYCEYHGAPFVKQEMSVAGWVVFGVLVVMCAPLCWIPFVVDGCKEPVRYCGRCGIRFG